MNKTKAKKPTETLEIITGFLILALLVFVGIKIFGGKSTPPAETPTTPAVAKPAAKEPTGKILYSNPDFRFTKTEDSYRVEIKPGKSSFVSQDSTGRLEVGAKLKSLELKPGGFISFFVCSELYYDNKNAIFYSIDKDFIDGDGWTEIKITDPLFKISKARVHWVDCN